MDENNRSQESAPSTVTPATDTSGTEPSVQPAVDPATTNTAPAAATYQSGTSPAPGSDLVSYQTTSSQTTGSYSPVPPEAPAPQSNGFAIASLILGILSILGTCCCGIGVLFGIVGIILGCLQPKDNLGNKPGMAIAGIVTSVIGILFGIGFFVLFAISSYRF